MIVNPTPQSPSTFSGMWVANLILVMEDQVLTDPLFPQSQGSIFAVLMPYDGEHLLSTGSKRVRISNLVAKRNSDPVAASVISALLAECERQSGKLGVRRVNVSAQDPTQGVRVRVDFSDNSSFSILDCFALARTDPTFASIFTTVMGWVATEAGLEVH